VLDEIVTAMAMRNRVELRGLGSFTVKNRGGRIGRNPKNGVKIRVAEKTVPVFRPSKEMHKRLNPVASNGRTIRPRFVVWSSCAEESRP
jgi:integration host factor subunit beta